MKTPNQLQVPVEFENTSSFVSAAYRQSGDHLVAFVHGFGCSKQSFAKAFDAPELQPYSLLAFDLWGHGESPRTKDFPYTMEAQADITQQAIQSFPHEKVSLVAHSMGGAIGLLVARNLMNLHAFVDVEGNLVGEDAGIVSRQTANQAENDFKYHGYDTFLGELRTSTDNAFREWGSWYQNADKVALHRSAKSLVQWSDSGQLLPILNQLPNASYIYGRDDKDYLLPHLQIAYTEYMPDSGHFMMIDEPEKFYGIVARLLEFESQ